MLAGNSPGRTNKGVLYWIISLFIRPIVFIICLLYWCFHKDWLIDRDPIVFVYTPKSDYIYRFPIDLEPNGRPFGSKSGLSSKKRSDSNTMNSRKTIKIRRPEMISFQRSRLFILFGIKNTMIINVYKMRRTYMSAY